MKGEEIEWDKIPFRIDKVLSSSKVGIDPYETINKVEKDAYMRNIREVIEGIKKENGLSKKRKFLEMKYFPRLYGYEETEHPIESYFSSYYMEDKEKDEAKIFFRKCLLVISEYENEKMKFYVELLANILCHLKVLHQNNKEGLRNILFIFKKGYKSILNEEIGTKSTLDYVKEVNTYIRIMHNSNNKEGLFKIFLSIYKQYALFNALKQLKINSFYHLDYIRELRGLFNLEEIFKMPEGRAWYKPYPVEEVLAKVIFDEISVERFEAFLKKGGALDQEKTYYELLFESEKNKCDVLNEYLNNSEGIFMEVDKR